MRQMGVIESSKFERTLIHLAGPLESAVSPNFHQCSGPLPAFPPPRPALPSQGPPQRGVLPAHLQPARGLSADTRFAPARAFARSPRQPTSPLLSPCRANGSKTARCAAASRRGCAVHPIFLPHMRDRPGSRRVPVTSTLVAWPGRLSPGHRSSCRPACVPWGGYGRPPLRVDAAKLRARLHRRPRTSVCDGASPNAAQ